MSRLKIGFIGCGSMAQKVQVLNIVALAEKCELAAIAELRLELGRKV